MASATSIDEYVFLDESYDDLNVDEFSDIDTTLLMALLRDSEAEDHELLPNMIDRPLLGDDDHEIMDRDQSYSETEESSSEDYYGLSEVDELESSSTSPHHHDQDFEWMDMEIGEMQGGYFVAADMVEEVGGLEDYAQACYGMSMEEDDYIALWQ